MKLVPANLAIALVCASLSGCGGPSSTSHTETPSAPPRSSDSPVTPPGEAVQSGLNPRDERIAALAAWFKEQGVVLECTNVGEGYTEWRVDQQEITGEYDLVFSIRSFPESASEKQMRAALDVNLRYELNAPARLAMSLGGFRGKHSAAELPKSDDELPRLNDQPLTRAVEQLFQQYVPR